MIHVSGLSQIYPDGTKGLNNISIDVEQGEFVAVIGGSGAGKSTFLRVLNGSLPYSSGDLHVLDQSLGRLKREDLQKIHRQMGFIYQQFNLVKGLTVLENVLLGRLGYHSAFSGMLGLFNKEEKIMAKDYIKDVGLEDKIKARVDRLSGGQQQRVAIARALVQTPKIILADEPMASLDPRLSDTILGLLKKFNERDKITVIVNIHVLEMAKRFSKRVVGFNGGRIVYDGPASGLTESKLGEIYGRQ